MLDVSFSIIKDDTQRNELEVFYSKHKNLLCSIALSKLQNIEDAEDAVQEVFSDIADKPENFFNIPTEKRLSYVVVMVRNISVDIFNSKNKITVEPLDETIEIGTVSFENALFENISRDDLTLFINQLPTLQRNVLMLHCFFDLPIDETAKRLNISLTAAKKRLMLARKAIKNFIDERNNDHE